MIPLVRFRVLLGVQDTVLLFIISLSMRVIWSEEPATTSMEPSLQGKIWGNFQQQPTILS